MMNIRFRVYANTCDQFKSLGGFDCSQVALVFAKDSGGHGNSNTSFKGEEINSFKRNNDKKVKFFLSIGGYPFNLEPEDVPNAVDSLTQIIRAYYFDGIDVYYEQIRVHPPQQFVEVMLEVIKSLKANIPNLEVSITVPPPLNDKYYWPLYEKVSDRIDYVIYQTYSMPVPVNTVRQLVEKFKGLQYPVDKLFAGYRVLSTDWNIVQLLVFLLTLLVLLNQGLISGIAVWAASDV